MGFGCSGSRPTTSICVSFRKHSSGNTDFCSERPIRTFERPLDVISSWNPESKSNMLLMKKSTLFNVLKRSAIPGVAPQFGGWVEWESRKGKWNKRWMDLRESSLFLAKKEHGPDETFLCSLSNFDAYVMTKQKSKKFIFALRSTDNATLFENPADYMHVFSCDPTFGRVWMERLLVSRVSTSLFCEGNSLMITIVMRSATRACSPVPTQCRRLYHSFT